MEIKLNSWVKLIKEPPINMYGSYAANSYKNDICSLVYHMNESGIYCNPSTGAQAMGLFNIGSFVIPREYLSIVDEKVALKAIDKSKKEFKIKNKKYYDQLKTKRVPVLERKDYNLSSKQLLNTQFNFANLYPITEKEIPEIKYNILSKNNATCCSFSRTTQDIVTYIPKSWLNYFGYNLYDLKAYFSFLSKCGIGYNTKVLGIININEKFKDTNVSRGQLTHYCNNNYIPDNDLFYEVLLKGSRTYSKYTYLYFILTRYIYNSAYWNIPFVAMKLKKNMPKATHWECLLLAHNLENYSGYYSLKDIFENQKLLPFNNSQERILENLKDTGPLNNCFSTINISENIKDLIINENYEKLQKLLDKYKK